MSLKIIKDILDNLQHKTLGWPHHVQTNNNITQEEFDNHLESLIEDGYVIEKAIYSQTLGSHRDDAPARYVYSITKKGEQYLNSI